MKKNDEEAMAKDSGSMKIQVLHDEKGNIISFALVKNGVTDGLSLVPKRNHSTKVVNLPDNIKKLSSEEDFKQLVNQIKQHKVDTNNKAGKLIRK
jgi:hypothetical protein